MTHNIFRFIFPFLILSGLHFSLQAEAPLRFGELTEAGEGGVATSLQDGIYGSFVVSEGILTPATSPLPEGIHHIGAGISVEVLPDTISVRNSDELRRLTDKKHPAFRKGMLSGNTIEMRGPEAGGDFSETVSQHFHGAFKNLVERCTLRSADPEDQAVLNEFGIGDAVVDQDAQYGNLLCEDFIVYKASPQIPAGETPFKGIVAGTTLVTIGIKAPMQNVTLRRITARSNNINWRLNPGDINFDWKINGFAIHSTSGPDANILIEDCRSEQMLGIGLISACNGGLTVKRFVHINGFDDMYRVVGTSSGDSEGIRLLGGQWIDPWTTHFYHPDLVHTFWDHASSPNDIRNVEIAFNVVVLGEDGMLAPTSPTSRITARAMRRRLPDTRDTKVAYREGEMYLGDTRNGDLTYTLPDLSSLDFPKGWKLAKATQRGDKTLTVVPGSTGTFALGDAFTLSSPNGQTRRYTIEKIEGNQWTLNYPLSAYPQNTPLQLRVALAIQKVMDGKGKLRVQCSGSDTLESGQAQFEAPDSYEYVEPWETWRFDSDPENGIWKMVGSGAPYQGIFSNSPKRTAKSYGRQENWFFHHNIVMVTAPAGYRISGGTGGVLPRDHHLSSNLLLTPWPGNLNKKNTPNSRFQSFGELNQRNSRISLVGDGHRIKGNIVSSITLNEERVNEGNYTLGSDYSYSDLQQLFDLSQMDQASEQFFAPNREEIIALIRPRAQGPLAGSGMGPGLGTTAEDDFVDWQKGELKQDTPWHVLDLKFYSRTGGFSMTWLPPAFNHISETFTEIPVSEYQIQIKAGDADWQDAETYNGTDLHFYYDQLPPGQSTRVRIRALNANGGGTWLQLPEWTVSEAEPPALLGAAVAVTAEKKSNLQLEVAAPPGRNRCLVAAISIQNPAASDTAIASVSFGGKQLIPLATRFYADNPESVPGRDGIALYSLPEKNIPTGSHPLRVTFSGQAPASAFLAACTVADTALKTPATATAYGGSSATAEIGIAPGDLLLAFAAGTVDEHFPPPMRGLLNVQADKARHYGQLGVMHSQQNAKQVTYGEPGGGGRFQIGVIRFEYPLSSNTD